MKRKIEFGVELEEKLGFLNMQIFKKINSDDNATMMSGEYQLGMKIDDIWRAMVFRHQGLFGSDSVLAKAKRLLYDAEDSKDVMLVVVAALYEWDFDIRIITPDMLYDLIPTTEGGIKSWNLALFGCLSARETTVMSLILTDEDRKRYAELCMKRRLAKEKTDSLVNAARAEASPKTPSELVTNMVNEMFTNIWNDPKYATATPAIIPTPDPIAEIPIPVVTYPAPIVSAPVAVAENKIEAAVTKAAEQEHPEDDKPAPADTSVYNNDTAPFKEDKVVDPGNVFDSLIIKDKKGYTLGDLVRMHQLVSLPEDRDATKDVPDEFKENNETFVSSHPKLKQFLQTIHSAKNGKMNAWFAPYTLIDGNTIIGAYLYKKSVVSNFVFIDDNMIYKNGMNILSANDPRGDIYNEIAIPLNSTGEVLDLINSKKINLANSPLNKPKYKPVLKRVDLTVVSFDDFTLWVQLMNNLSYVISSNKVSNNPYRYRITDYKTPGNFRLIADSAVKPAVDFSVNNTSTTYWVDYNSKKYNREKFKVGATELVVPAAPMVEVAPAIEVTPTIA